MSRETAPVAGPTAGYPSGALSKDRPGERERLRLLEVWGDPHTRDVLGATGLAPDWRCLELGAGSGSVARWLAGRSPDGGVVAVDSDTRYLRDDLPPNLDVRAEDIRVLDLEPASFDLVHSRLTFCHLPERTRLVRTAAGWLRPGGTLVIGDPLCIPAAASVYPEVRRFYGALEHGWSAQGSDMTTWAMTLPAQLARAGLRDVGTSTRPNRLGEQGPYGALAEANLRQEGSFLVERGLLDPADVAAVLRLMADPAFTDLRSITVYAWGRAPGPEES